MNILLQKRVDAFIGKLLANKYKWNDEQMNYVCQSLQYEDGSSISTNDYLQDCLNNKRCGNYDEAISGYLDVLECSYPVIGTLSPGVARALFKCLVASNDYHVAWLLVKQMSETLKKSTSFSQELQLTLYYLNTDMVRLSGCAHQVVNGYEFDELFEITQSYSGNPNYTFVKEKNDIRKEFIAIANNIEK